MNLPPRSSDSTGMRASGEPVESETTASAALTDELLAIRCQLGERDALDALVDRWHAPLWQYVRRMSGDDDVAAETLQDTWLRVLRALPALCDPTRLRSWLFGIARRAVMDRLRAAFTDEIETNTDVDTLPTDDGMSDDGETIGTVREALESLAVGPRETLVLFYLHELTLHQIADVLSIPVGTVKSRLFTAHTMLQRELLSRGQS